MMKYQSFEENTHSGKSWAQRFFVEAKKRVKDGLLKIQANLAESVERNRVAIENYAEVERSFERVVSQSGVIRKETQSVSRTTQEAMEKIMLLNKSIKTISNMVSEIRDIAKKSKLLSFNASVEAVRAGEAGKSFAVVADEFAKFSDDTNKFLADVEQSIETISDVSHDLDKTADKNLKATQDMSRAMDEFDRELTKTNEENTRSLKSIFASNDRIFMSLAKLDHVIWKINTYLSVDQGRPIFDFVNHHNCRLGKWYYQGQGHENFAMTSSYSALERPHAGVHDGTQAIFELLKSKGDLNIEALEKATAQMEQASEEVFSYLDKILNEKTILADAPDEEAAS